MSIKLTAQQKNKSIYTAADIYAIIQPILLRENRMRRKLEYFWVLGIDHDRYLKFAELLAHAYSLAGLGDQNRVHIKAADACLTARQAFRMAIYKETDYVIFIHNPRLTERGRHPTGKLQLSPDDKDATDRLIKAREVVDIKVADHFIISETKYLSFVPNWLGIA